MKHVLESWHKQTLFQGVKKVGGEVMELGEVEVCATHAIALRWRISVCVCFFRPLFSVISIFSRRAASLRSLRSCFSWGGVFFVSSQKWCIYEDIVLECFSRAQDSPLATRCSHVWLSEKKKWKKLLYFIFQVEFSQDRKGWHGFYVWMCSSGDLLYQVDNTFEGTKLSVIYRPSEREASGVDTLRWYSGCCIITASK